MNDRYPAFITWEVNSTCNHRCIFCYNYNQKEYAPEAYSDENLHKISDFIVSQRPIHVTVSGGEMLLMFPQIKPHICKMLEHNIGIRLFTNGSLISEEIAAFCAKHDIHLMISFPSVDRVAFAEITGCAASYDRVLDGFRILKEHGVSFQPNIVVTTKNLATLRDTVLFLDKEFSPEGIFVSRATKPSNAQDDFDSLLLNNDQLQQMFQVCVELKKKHNLTMKTCGGFPLCAFYSKEAFEIFGKICGAGNMDFVLTSTGDVRVCTRDQHVYGNIFANDFRDIREKMKIWKQYQAPAECRDCNAKRSCKGGCHMASVKPDRNPGSIDYNADPQNTPIRFSKRSAFRPASIFRAYRVLPFTCCEDHGQARISREIAYDYFELQIGDLLKSESKLSVWKVKAHLGISYLEAKMIINKLLRIQVLK